eukprot:TRINITY_DN7424_c0_g1_i1.p1 TRINITY_DN7424_c0_g1~~TRINITY_DN7424_c0_g1_i1.p1  ORF type:complete len:467 (-),score=75.93 TRINITY_DN7424_c0_g1_i1:135-1535(-)
MSLLLRSLASTPKFITSNFARSYSLVHLKKYPQTRITTLPNGMRVATEQGMGETATVGVWIDTGSRYENAKNNGVAHFLEHIIFKGTKRRSQRDLEIEVENIGGHLNAYTSREQTVFYTKGFRQDVPQAMDLLGDLLQNSLIDPGAVERERSVILREMDEVNHQPEEVVFDRLHEVVFRGTPLAYTILGPTENINSITREDILDYVGTHYTAPRMVICGAGAIDHNQLVRLAQQHFGSFPTLPKTGKKVQLIPAKFTGSDIRVRNDAEEYAHCALGFQTAGWTDPDNFPLMIIQMLLGSHDQTSKGSSHSPNPLVRFAAEHKAIFKSYTPFNTQYSDTGLFGIYFVSEAYGLYQVFEQITQYIQHLGGILSEAQLNERKNQLKMIILASLDGSTTVAEDIGRQMLSYGRRMHPLEMMSRIDAVDIPAIRKAIFRFFENRDFGFAAVGPTFELVDTNATRIKMGKQI